MGEPAGPALRRAADAAPAEARRRLEALLADLDAGRPNAETLRGLRAIELLEHVGGAEARRVLEALAGGVPEARQTREAKGSLARLANRPDPSR
jgi:hypothetical protein